MCFFYIVNVDWNVLSKKIRYCSYVQLSFHCQRWSLMWRQCLSTCTFTERERSKQDDTEKEHEWTQRGGIKLMNDNRGVDIPLETKLSHIGWFFHLVRRSQRALSSSRYPYQFPAGCCHVCGTKALLLYLSQIPCPSLRYSASMHLFWQRRQHWQSRFNDRSESSLLWSERCSACSRRTGR